MALNNEGVRLELTLDHDALRSDQIGTVQAVCRIDVLAKAPPRRRHYVFVIDSSASMLEHQKWTTLVATLKSVVTCISGDDYVSFIAFSHEVSVYLCAERFDATTITNVLDAIKPSGSTNLSDVLLKHVPTALAACEAKNDTVLHVVMLLTDGQPTSGIRNLATLTKQMKHTYAPFQSRLILSTFGYGIDHLSTWLYHLAAQFHGLYAYIASTQNVANAFDMLLKQVASVAIAHRVLVLKAMPGIRIVKIQAVGALTEIVVCKQYHLALSMLRERESRHVLLKLSINRQSEYQPKQHLLSAQFGSVHGSVHAHLRRMHLTNPIAPTVLTEQQLRFRTTEALHAAIAATVAKQTTQAEQHLTDAHTTLAQRQTKSDFLCDLCRDVQLCLTVLRQNRDNAHSRLLAYMYGLALMYAYERPVPTAWLHAEQSTLECVEGFTVPPHQTQRTTSYGYINGPDEEE